MNIIGASSHHTKISNTITNIALASKPENATSEVDDFIKLIESDMFAEPSKKQSESFNFIKELTKKNISTINSNYEQAIVSSPTLADFEKSLEIVQIDPRLGSPILDLLPISDKFNFLDRLSWKSPEILNQIDIYGSPDLWLKDLVVAGDLSSEQGNLLFGRMGAKNGTGNVTTYHNNSDQVRKVIPMLNGVRDGHFTEFTKKGLLNQSFYYVNGSIEGEMPLFPSNITGSMNPNTDSSNTPNQIITFKDGKPSHIEYYLNGNLTISSPTAGDGSTNYYDSKNQQGVGGRSYEITEYFSDAKGINPPSGKVFFTTDEGKVLKRVVGFDKDGKEIYTEYTTLDDFPKISGKYLNMESKINREEYASQSDPIQNLPKNIINA